jgi:hypothetical protein
VILSVQDNDTVFLPNDYIDYVVVGIVNGGKMSSLGLNNNLSVRTTDGCGDIQTVAAVSPSEDGAGYVYNTTHFTENGQYSGRSFGAGGGGNSNGNFKIYKSKGYISLNGVSASEIVLKYLATAERVDGNFMVEDFLVEAIKSYIWYKYVRRSRSYGISDKELAARDWRGAKKEALIRVNRFSIPEFLNAYRSGYRSSPSI